MNVVIQVFGFFYSFKDIWMILSVISLFHPKCFYVIFKNHFNAATLYLQMTNWKLLRFIYHKEIFFFRKESLKKREIKYYKGSSIISETFFVTIFFLSQIKWKLMSFYKTIVKIWLFCLGTRFCEALWEKHDQTVGIRPGKLECQV